MRLGAWLCFWAIVLPNVIPAVSAATNGAYACPVTVPPDPQFVPPVPYRASAYQGAFWYGTRELWTSLPLAGVWHLDRTNAGYSNKLFLWQEGYDFRNDPHPDIIVVVNRLDTTAPPVVSRGGTNAHFDNTWLMLTGVTFPTEGCWQITSSHNGHNLTFVLLVQP